MITMKREPRLRFPGFSGEWEEKKLDELANCLDNLRKPLNSQERSELKGDIPYYGANGVVDYVNDFIFDKKLILLAEDGGNFENFSNRPIAQLIKGKSWVNNHAHVLESRENADFLFFSLEHKDVRKYINGTSRSKLNKSDMLEIKIPNPTLAEQEKIADCLTAMDESIDSQQQKVEQLKAYKKGLLQQLFSQSIRFPGFEGEWEEKKLGEMGDTYTGLTGKTKEDFGIGDAKFVTYMNVFSNTFSTLNQLEKVFISDNEKQNEVQKGDIFFTTSSETPTEAGMSSCWEFDLENVYLNSFCFGYRLKNDSEVSFEFLAHNLRNPLIRKKISILAQGSTRFNISKNELMKMNILVPTITEQQKIANCLSTLDEVIKLESQKLEQLRQYKKGLLQQLFV